MEREAKAQRDLLESYLAKYREATTRENIDAVPADGRIISRAIVSNTPAYPKKLPTVLIATMVALAVMVVGCATAPFDGYVEKPARVSSTCLVAVARNRYSVPCELAGKLVSTRLYPYRVKVVAGDALVADHERLSDEGRTQYDWQHYLPLLQRKPGALRNGAPFADLPEPLQRLRRALLREDGGDRVMAQVLAIVPTTGLDTVLVAVELALESAPPSGRVSVEHVRNVLARLDAAPRPDNVVTALQVSTPPLANTARYDTLRAVPAAADNGTEVDHA